MKWFQIRILHRILGTNVVLKQMGIRNNDKCSFCNTVKDSIQHLFWECEIIQQYWRLFVELINGKCHTSYRMKVTERLVILGNDTNIKTDTVFDFILLFAKHYLYQCKMQNCQPNITVFKKKLLFRYKIEEYNAKLNMNHVNFSVNWSAYMPLFDFEEI